MSHPKEPTAEQCSAGVRVEDFNDLPAYACWYPQMGGYVGKCVVVIAPDDADCADRCFDAFVWHNGAFPFSDDYDQQASPVLIHHCMPSQFTNFAEFVLEKQGAPPDVFTMIEDEQRLVRASIATEGRDDLLSVPEWVSLLTRHVGLAAPHVSGEAADLDRVLKQMIRVGQLAVSCAESILRKKERARAAGPTEEQRSQWKGW